MISEFRGDFIQWLRGFYYTATTGSISAASELMQRSQPALSHQIKQLEQELGVKLFQDSRTQRTLTESGKYLLEYTVRIFDIMHEIQDTIHTIPTELSGDVSVAAMFSVLQYYLVNRIVGFNAEFSKINLLLHATAESETLYYKVQTQQVDFGILSPITVPPDLHFERLFDTQLVLITPQTGPYTIDGPFVNLELIAEFPFIYPSPKSTLGIYLQQQFEKYGLSMRKTHMVEHQESLKMCVSAGMGISILDDIVAVDSSRESINILSLSKFFPARTYGIVYRRGVYFPPPVEALLNFLRTFSD